MGHRVRAAQPARRLHADIAVQGVGREDHRLLTFRTDGILFIY